MNELIEELQEVIQMIENDTRLTGKYKISEDTKKYASDIKSDLQEIIDKYK